VQIRVLRFRGRAPDTLTEAQFGETGGTIGRSPQCTLVLPDPERHISRIQAEINCSGAEYVLVDRGIANPVQRNGAAVGTGRSVPLRDGDELHVGDYVLRVEFSKSGAPVAFDPFADLIAPQREQTAVPVDHPLAPGAPSTAAVIPDDFDPFVVKSRSPMRDPLGLGDGLSARVSAPAEDSIDVLFGLGGASANPLDVGAPFGPPAAQPNTSAGLDPISALETLPVAPQAPVPDQGAEIHAQFQLPAAHPASNTAFRSWDSPGAMGHTMIVGKSGPRVPIATTSNPEVRAPAHEPRVAKVMTSRNPDIGGKTDRRDSPPALAPAPQPAPCDDASLLQALLSGVGLMELPRDPSAEVKQERLLDAATMRRVGSLLRLFAQGMVDLLATRATFKHEMHAKVTIIAAQDNNPVKFSPNAAAAMQHLLGQRSLRGFMEPEAAVRDAMNDLAAHQVAVISGMRAAMQGLLQRFEPAQLQQRLAGRSVLDSMLPMNRKAKLWELFEEVFADVSREAEDDFEAMFGREFVKAYEAQIKNLESRDDQST
jgi:FHA domain-containing protein